VVMVLFRYAAHNFSGAMARSAKLTIVEVSNPSYAYEPFRSPPTAN
jgi:hypothetical protein